ncbi:hypothetical protein DFH06DRAFT_1317031 [Mycena polygramma]|nr:hypothetical protein DFH06DRAFT_1317031 [Mycena polygramma]
MASTEYTEETTSTEDSARTSVRSYDVATTTVVYGLPAAEQQRVLASYRALWQAQTEHTLPIVEYDLSCQYWKNVRAMEQHGTHTDSDDDSIFSSDSVPPLMSVSPSSSEAPPVENAAAAHESVGEASATDAQPDSAPATPAGEPVGDGQDGERAPRRHGQWVWGGSAGEFVSAASLLGIRRTDGEGVERGWAHQSVDGEPIETRWANENPTWGTSGRQYGEYVRSGTSEVHDVRIINLQGVRDVKCDCDDGLHAVYSRRVAHAFIDADGHLVIKKSKTLLLPLN